MNRAARRGRWWEKPWGIPVLILTCFLACSLFSVGGWFLFLCFRPDAQVTDTKAVSPDGAYTATVHDVDLGAAGSYSQALLRISGDKKDVVLVDGGSEFISGMKWTGVRELTVTTCQEGSPEPDWPKSWRGVRIVYNF